MRGTLAGGAQRVQFSGRVETPEADPGGEETVSMDLSQAEPERNHAGPPMSGVRSDLDQRLPHRVDPGDRAKPPSRTAGSAGPTPCLILKCRSGSGGG